MEYEGIAGPEMESAMFFYRGFVNMEKRIDLLNGRIFKALVTMAVPIMATSFLQMAYNMIDMIWIGRVGSGSVAAVGAAAMFVNLGTGIGTFLKVGGQVCVARRFGAGKNEEAALYARNAIQLGVVIAVVYGLILCLFKSSLIGFFRFTDQVVIREAELYLHIMGMFIFLSIINPVCTAIINATANSKTPFKINTVGLLINIIADPLLIFGIGPIPRLGVLGAAIATVSAQFVVFILFILYMKKDEKVFTKMHFSRPMKKYVLKDIIKIGWPASVQCIMFSGISMTIGRIIATWGEVAVAVQKVGIQIESVSFMAAEGFSLATDSFIAQNYGAKQFERANEGYKTGLKIMIIWGLITTTALVFFPEMIFKIFIPEADVIPYGADYLRILGYSQLFMCIEILTGGAFAAYGKTIIPSTVSIVFTGMRIPLGIVLGSTSLGLNGVWWAISISSMFKGVILVVLFRRYMKKFLVEKTLPDNEKKSLAEA